MEQRTHSPYPRLDRPTLALIGGLLILSCGLFFASDRAHDWRYYQDEFRQIVGEKFGEDKEAAVAAGVLKRQVEVPRSGATGEPEHTGECGGSRGKARRHGRSSWSRVERVSGARSR